MWYWTITYHDQNSQTILHQEEYEPHRYEDYGRMITEIPIELRLKGYKIDFILLFHETRIARVILKRDIQCTNVN